MELGKGEALVSFLEGNGTPTMVERCLIRPPSARVGPITADERKSVMDKSPVKGKYDQEIDSESAYEVLQKRMQQTGTTAPQPQIPEGQAQGGGGGVLATIGGVLSGIFGISNKHGERYTTGQLIARSVTRTVTNNVAGKIAADLGKSVGGKMGGSIGRAIIRGALGGMMRRN
jgi:hypothetical protein